MDFAKALRVVGDYGNGNIEYDTVVVESPCRAGSREAGIDFYVPDEFQEIVLKNGESTMIPMGVHVRVPQGHALVFFNKSGVSVKKGLKVGACVVDETFQGELKLNLFKDSSAGGDGVSISPNEKIIQGLLIPINYSMPSERLLDELYPEKSERGDKGWGSNYQEEAMVKKDEAMEYATEKFDSAKEAAGDVVDMASGAVEDVREMAGELAGEAKEKAGKLFGKAKGLFGKKN